MATRYTDEFRRDAVRIATTSGLTRPQAASDLGVGLSTWLCCINRLMDSCRESSVVAAPHEQTDIADLQDHKLDCLQ
jgi:transposase